MGHLEYLLRADFAAVGWPVQMVSLTGADLFFLVVISILDIGFFETTVKE